MPLWCGSSCDYGMVGSTHAPSRYPPPTECDGTALCSLPFVMAAPKEDDQISTRCPIFEGVSANFVTWLISFTAWVAWKAPELVPILNGSLTAPPAPLIAGNPTAVERKRLKEWTLHNTQLYGALVSHVATHIQASLHVQSSGDGLAAVKYLKQRYGSQSTGDRAEATARLQRSYIDARAKLSETDVIRQFNEMSCMAASDIVAAGAVLNPMMPCLYLCSRILCLPPTQ